MEGFMKYLKQVLFTILSILSIQTQTKPKPWIVREVEKLESDRYPLNETKKITLTMPNCEENIWAYVEYNNTSQRLIFSKEHSRQSLELISEYDKNSESVHNSPKFRVSFVPETDAKTYLNYLKNTDTEKPVDNGVVLVSQIKTDMQKQREESIKYEEMLKKFNNARKEILILDFNLLKDGQVVTIPAYQSDEQIKQAEIKKAQMNTHHIESDIHSIKINKLEQEKNHEINLHGINLKMIHPEEKHIDTGIHLTEKNTDTGIHLANIENHTEEMVHPDAQPTDLTEEEHAINKEA
jgi:hypothetical protein